MVSVSSAFKTASTAVKRFAKAMIEIVWTDPYLDPFLSVESSNKNYGIEFAESNNADVLKQVADNILTSAHKYTLLDGSWHLGDGKVLAPSTQTEVLNNQIGWYSKSVADANGDFSTHPAITVNFDPAGRVVSNIRVVGDSLLNQYPVDFVVRIYDGTTVLHTETVTSNDNISWYKQFTDILGATSIGLEISKWSTANTVAKITEFFSLESDTFDGDTIISMDLLEEREAKNGTSPTGNMSLNELTLKLQNIEITASDGNTYKNPFTYGNTDNNRFNNFLKPNRRINAYLGFKFGTTIEFVKVGTFWTKGDWRCNEMDFSTSVTAYDRLGILKNCTFECPEIDNTLTNVNLKDLAEIVLNHAKVSIPLADLVWDIGDDLADFTVPIAWFDKGSYFDAIKYIAEACLGCAWMSKDDVLMIRSYHINDDKTTDLEITRDDYYDKNQPSNIDSMKNYVEVAVQTITKNTGDKVDVNNVDKVYTVAGNTEEEIEIQYNSTPVSEVVVSIGEDPTGSPSIKAGSFKPFSYGCKITIINSSPDVASFKLIAKGYEYTLNNDTLKIAKDANLITEYGRKELKYSNHLVQDGATAQLIANTVVSRHGPYRSDVTLRWRGDPSIEVGDIIEVPEYQDNTAKFTIVKNDWSFDGTLSCNTEAKRVYE